MEPASRKHEHSPQDTSRAKAAQAQQDARSDHDTIPGAELPVAVYASAFAAFAWILAASWLAFASGADAELALAVATILTIVFFALPVLVWLTARSRSDKTRDDRGDFLASRVETATGPLSGASVWLQILLIPVALALAATLIGITSAVMQ
jgi:ABC-type transport system involved in cytochrome bd biosynthesis fused ATPase/permease subunit